MNWTIITAIICLSSLSLLAWIVRRPEEDTIAQNITLTSLVVGICFAILILLTRA